MILDNDNRHVLDMDIRQRYWTEILDRDVRQRY